MAYNRCSLALRNRFAPLIMRRRMIRVRKSSWSLNGTLKTKPRVPDDLFDFGTVATILQLIRLPDKTVKILVEGGSRAEVLSISDGDEFFVSEVNIIEEAPVSAAESEALVRSLMSAFDQYVQLSKKVPAEVMTSLSSVDDPESFG